MRILKNIDKKYTIGILIGLTFGLLSVYVDFFKTSEPKLEIDILSNATVFDIKENIGNLDVLYDSTSLTKQGKTLSLLTIKISNIGNDAILKEYFDTIVPVHLYINNSKIVQIPQIIETNDNYLKRSVSFIRKDNNGFILRPFIFDKNKYFVIKITAIHPIDVIPELKVDGKIAKIDSIEIINSFKDLKKQSFFTKILDGNFLIHITRFLFYLITITLFSVVVITPIVKISDSILIRKRKKIINRFRNLYKEPINENGELLLDFYINNGSGAIIRFKKIFENQQRFKNLFSIINDDNDFYFAKHKNHNPMDTTVGILINELKDKDIIKIIDKKFNIDHDFEIFMNDLLKFTKTVEISTNT